MSAKYKNCQTEIEKSLNARKDKPLRFIFRHTILNQVEVVPELISAIRDLKTTNKWIPNLMTILNSMIVITKYVQESSFVRNEGWYVEI